MADNYRAYGKRKWLHWNEISDDGPSALDWIGIWVEPQPDMSYSVVKGSKK